MNCGPVATLRMQNRRWIGLFFKFRTTIGHKRNAPTFIIGAVHTTPKMFFWRGHAMFSPFTNGWTLPHHVMPATGMGKYYCSLTGNDVKKRVEAITDLFSDARELLEDARSSAGTVYFNDDIQDAKEAVKDALGQYEDLLGMLSTEQKQNVVASIGLKMEELKAQLIAITEEHDDP